MDLQAVLAEVESWPVEERIRLVQEVWDRIVEEGGRVEFTAEMKAEMDRRIEELDRDPDAGIPWEAVKARALERIRK